MKQYKTKQNLPTAHPSPSAIRAEIDACVHFIAAQVEKNPKKVAVIFESWLNQSKNTTQKKKAA